MEGKDGMEVLETCSNSPRKSGREKRQRRSFSPDIMKKSKRSKMAHKVSSVKNRYILTKDTGFCCGLCKSPHVSDPMKSKRGCRSKKSRHNPSPKVHFDIFTAKTVEICNACALILSPVKKPETVPQLKPENKDVLLREAKEFALCLATELEDKDAERLYCSHFKSLSICGCLQSYLHDDQEVKARHLLCLMKEARSLSKLKSYKSDSEKKVYIGLGNGQKRSKEFEDFILKKREYIRQDLKLCETACKQVLLYSNNFLHKNIKTEERRRMKRTKCKGKLNILPDIETVHKEHCCIDNCVKMAISHSYLLHEWRSRAQTCQVEARRVLGEMLTPSGGYRSNCYKFIHWITGCSNGTIQKVNTQMKTTRGNREPPRHGLRKNWEYSPNLDATILDSDIDVSNQSTETNKASTSIPKSTDSPTHQTTVTSHQELYQLQKQILNQFAHLQNQQNHGSQQTLLQQEPPPETTQNTTNVQYLLGQLANLQQAVQKIPPDSSKHLPNNHSNQTSPSVYPQGINTTLIPSNSHFISNTNMLQYDLSSSAQIVNSQNLDQITTPVLHQQQQITTQVLQQHQITTPVLQQQHQITTPVLHQQITTPVLQHQQITTPVLQHQQIITPVLHQHQQPAPETLTKQHSDEFSSSRPVSNEQTQNIDLNYTKSQFGKVPKRVKKSTVKKNFKNRQKSSRENTSNENTTTEIQTSVSSVMHVIPNQQTSSMVQKESVPGLEVPVMNVLPDQQTSSMVQKESVPGLEVPVMHVIPDQQTSSMVQKESVPGLEVPVMKEFPAVVDQLPQVFPNTPIQGYVGEDGILNFITPLPLDSCTFISSDSSLAGRSYPTLAPKPPVESTGTIQILPFQQISNQTEISGSLRGQSFIITSPPANQLLGYPDSQLAGQTVIYQIPQNWQTVSYNQPEVIGVGSGMEQISFSPVQTLPTMGHVSNASSSEIQISQNPGSGANTSIVPTTTRINMTSVASASANTPYFSVSKIPPSTPAVPTPSPNPDSTSKTIRSSPATKCFTPQMYKKGQIPETVKSRQAEIAKSNKSATDSIVGNSQTIRVTTHTHRNVGTGGEKSVTQCKVMPKTPDTNSKVNINNGSNTRSSATRVSSSSNTNRTQKVSLDVPTSREKSIIQAVESSNHTSSNIRETCVSSGPRTSTVKTRSVLRPPPESTKREVKVAEQPLKIRNKSGNKSNLPKENHANIVSATSLANQNTTSSLLSFPILLSSSDNEQVLSIINSDPDLTSMRSRNCSGEITLDPSFTSLSTSDLLQILSSQQDSKR